MKTIFLLLIVLFVCSCTGHEEVNDIGESEFYFDEKLISISSDENGSFWVGSETGDIFNFKDNQRETFNLGEDRIYKIRREITDSQDTLFWIGVRNSGLQKWEKNQNLEKLKTYLINFKQNQYSVYDFDIVGDNVYTATSQGLYSLNKKNDPDSLQLIFPSYEFFG